MEWSQRVYNSFRSGLLKLCVDLRITPNQVTIFNHILTLTFGVYFFSRGTHVGYLLGIGICVLNGILDYLDGDLAKTTGRVSAVGVWLDSGFDTVIQNAIMAAIAMGCFKQGLPLWELLLFLVGNAASNLVSFRYNETFGFSSSHGNQLFRKYMDTNRGLFNISLKNMIDPTSSKAGLVLFTYRYWIVLGSMLNQMPVMFICMSVITNLRWITMYVIYAFHLQKYKKLYVNQALAILDAGREEFYKCRANGIS